VVAEAFVAAHDGGFEAGGGGARHGWSGVDGVDAVFQAAGVVE
jgi:hypothetical protein